MHQAVTHTSLRASFPGLAGAGDRRARTLGRGRRLSAVAPPVWERECFPPYYVSARPATPERAGGSLVVRR